VLVGELDGASQRQELNVLELHVTSSLVLSITWIEFGDDAVEDVAVVVDDENISDADVFVIQQRLAQFSDNLVEVLIALEALESERDTGHDGLFLLDNHARVGADSAEVEVVLDTEGEAEHQGKEQQEPGSETLYLGAKSHAETKRGICASDVVNFW